MQPQGQNFVWRLEPLGHNSVMCTGYTCTPSQRSAKRNSTRPIGRRRLYSTHRETVKGYKKAQQTQRQARNGAANRLQSYSHFCIYKMAVSRHLRILKLVSCTITSADPENSTLELNISCLCCIQPELYQFNYFFKQRPSAIYFKVIQGHRP